MTSPATPPPSHRESPHLNIDVAPGLEFLFRSTAHTNTQHKVLLVLATYQAVHCFLFVIALSVFCLLVFRFLDYCVGFATLLTAACFPDIVFA